MNTFVIEFQPVGRRGDSRENESLLACSRRLGLGVNSVCGGKGTCSSCRIRLLSGDVSAPTETEVKRLTAGELNAGWRLACQTRPLSDCLIHVPAESMSTSQRIQVESREAVVRIDPPVKTYDVILSPASLDDLEADADRLLSTLNREHKVDCHSISFAAMKTISTDLRRWEWKCRAAVRDNRVIAVLPLSEDAFGFAVDIGTTKVAGYLVDLHSGRVLAASGIMNPQINYGEDVITRITVAMNSRESALELQQAVVTALNGLLKDLCIEAGVDDTRVLESVIVGNTAMHHLFLGLPVRQLAVSPFVPCTGRAVDIAASEIGLNISPGGYVHILPNIAGFIGADHVSGLLASLPSITATPAVFIDIGTNTEVSLIKSKNAITAVSCASGPAFEGGHIRYGMRAGSGAIERVKLQNGVVELQTIDNEPPAGICGSGILDAVAQLYLAGIINEGGRLLDNRPGVRQSEKGLEFVLIDGKHSGTEDIVITQQDIREIQLAKSAIRTGMQILLEANNLTEDDIKTFVIAGAFGTYIDISSAIEIGMLPAIDIARFKQVGNAAGMGARIALVSRRGRKKAQRIASQVKYIELANTPGFMKTFTQANYLGRYRLIEGKRLPL